MNGTNPETEPSSPNPAPSGRQASDTGDSADRTAEPLTPESELRIIVARSGSNPDPADLARVRELLSDCPALWRIAGDPARRAAALTLDRSGLDPVEREGATAGFADLLRQLDYDNSHPLACLLIDQVALRWLHLGALEHAYSRETNLTLRDRGEWEKRISLAHRRLTTSVTSLAQINRLLGSANC